MRRLTPEALRSLLNGLSAIVIFAIVFQIYSLFHEFDWGFPLVKLFGFVTIGVLIVYLAARNEETLPSRAFALAELAIFGVVLCVIFFHYGPAYGPDVMRPPRVDIGTTTVKAAKLLFEDHENPYSSREINPRPELAPQHRGYHYGPLMLLAYAPSLVFENAGYKWTSVFYLVCAAALLILLVRSDEQTTLAWASTAVCVLCLFFLSERFWYEMLTQGANDIFPVALILASLYALKRERLSLAGLLAGLSFSAKFSPAAFFIIPFLRKDLRLGFFRGIAWGLVPLAAFALRNPTGLMNNVFAIRFALRFDSTSVYSVTPPGLRFLFPLILGLALLAVLAINFKRPVTVWNILVSFTLLLIVGEVTFKEIHTNHLIWFFPFFALILGQRRHSLFLYTVDPKSH